MSVCDVADRAVVNLLDGFNVWLLVAALGPGGDAELPADGVVVGLKNAAGARSVHADRLLREDVNASLDSGLQVLRPEARRRRQDDVVQARHAQHLFMAIQAGETAFLRQVDRIAQLLHSAGILRTHVQQPLSQPLHSKGKSVAQGHDLNIRRRLEHVERRPGASVPATDDSHLDRVAANCMHIGQQSQVRS